MNWRDQLREPVAPEHMCEPPGGFDPGPRSVVDEKREHEYREDMIKWERELKAQRGLCLFCEELWTLQFPDALGGEK